MGGGGCPAPALLPLLPASHEHLPFRRAACGMEGELYNSYSYLQFSLCLWFGCKLPISSSLSLFATASASNCKLAPPLTEERQRREEEAGGRPAACLPACCLPLLKAMTTHPDRTRQHAGRGTPPCLPLTQNSSFSRKRLKKLSERPFAFLLFKLFALHKTRFKNEEASRIPYHKKHGSALPTIHFRFLFKKTFLTFTF